MNWMSNFWNKNEGKIGFSFYSALKFSKRFRYHDIAVYSYCILPKPYCNSKSSVNIQKTEDNYSFLCFILAPGRKLDTLREK